MNEALATVQARITQIQSLVQSVSPTARPTALATGCSSTAMRTCCPRNSAS